MVLTATLTTGCTDENEDVAYNLWGTWEGNMYMQSQYNGRVYQSSYRCCVRQEPISVCQRNGLLD